MDNIVLIADYGRSGQGWLSYMLCYILNAQYVEPYDFANGVRYTRSDHVLSLTQGRLEHRPQTQYSLIVKTHNHPAPDFDLTPHVIYLTRDPRDVAVSKHCRHLANLQRSRTRGPQAGNTSGLLGGAIDRVLAIRTVRFLITASRWKKHALAWRRIQAFHVTYEDLVTNVEDTLTRVLGYLNADADRDTVRAAISEFSFERITGRKQGQEDPLNPEYRKGISGDHENYFNAFHRACFRMICGKAAALYGYRL